MALDHEEYVELVLRCAEAIPRGRVTTYGAIADFGGGGPRQVGRVMSQAGGPVPWWGGGGAGGVPPEGHGEGGHAD